MNFTRTQIDFSTARQIPRYQKFVVTKSPVRGFDDVFRGAEFFLQGLE